MKRRPESDLPPSQHLIMAGQRLTVLCPITIVASMAAAEWRSLVAKHHDIPAKVCDRINVVINADGVADDEDISFAFMGDEVPILMDVMNYGPNVGYISIPINEYSLRGWHGVFDRTGRITDRTAIARTLEMKHDVVV
jgi:hypothetical protein